MIPLHLVVLLFLAGSSPVQSWTTFAACATDTGVSEVLHPTQTFDASSFCSEFLQGTTYINELVTATTISTPLTAVVHTVTSTTTTVTDPRVSTTTDLCPTPSASQVCGLVADGNGNNLITNIEPLAGQACQQLCLANAACKSFQVVDDNGTTRCNLYNAPASVAAVGGNFDATFYDQGCSDLLPAGCKAAAASPPAATSAPSLADAAVKDRGLDKRTYSYPTFLNIGQEYMAYICSCIITSALPVVTVYQTFISEIYSVTTITSVQTQTVVISEHPNLSTVYSSVS